MKENKIAKHWGENDKHTTIRNNYSLTFCGRSRLFCEISILVFRMRLCIYSSLCVWVYVCLVGFFFSHLSRAKHLEFHSQTHFTALPSPFVHQRFCLPYRKAVLFFIFALCVLRRVISIAFYHQATKQTSASLFGLNASHVWP